MSGKFKPVEVVEKKKVSVLVQRIIDQMVVTNSDGTVQCAYCNNGGPFASAEDITHIGTCQYLEAIDMQLEEE